LGPKREGARGVLVKGYIGLEDVKERERGRTVGQSLSFGKDSLRLKSLSNRARVNALFNSSSKGVMIS